MPGPGWSPKTQAVSLRRPNKFPLWLGSASQCRQRTPIQSRFLLSRFVNIQALIPGNFSSQSWVSNPFSRLCRYHIAVPLNSTRLTVSRTCRYHSPLTTLPLSIVPLISWSPPRLIKVLISPPPGNRPKKYSPDSPHFLPTAQMASFVRPLARAATRTTTRNAFATAPRQAFRQQGRRFYSSEPAAPKPSSSIWLYLTGAAAAGGLGYWYVTASGAPSAASVKAPSQADYQKVYDDIAARLEEKDDYDDGSYGPVLLRLAWHASGTFDKMTGTGGSNGATMRFAPESDHGGNAGLLAARDFLDPVKGRFLCFLHSRLP